MIEKDLQAALDVVKNTISDLLQNKIDLSLLTITKALTKESGEDEETQIDPKISKKSG